MDEQTAEMEPPSLGAYLAKERERASLTQIDVAKAMRLSVQTVIDIEADDYSHGSAIIYLRGYLRGYARLLNLEAEPILARFEQSSWVLEQKAKEHASHSAFKIQPVSTQRRQRRHLLRWSVIALGLIVVLLVASWWHTQKNHPHSVINGAPSLVLPAQNLPAKTGAPKSAAKNAAVTVIQLPNTD